MSVLAEVLGYVWLVAVLFCVLVFGVGAVLLAVRDTIRNHRPARPVTVLAEYRQPSNVTVLPSGRGEAS